MYSKLNNVSVLVYAYLVSLALSARKLERGDADSSSSTLRTFGVVMLVLAVILTIGVLLYATLTPVQAAINGALTTFLTWIPK